MLFLFLVFSDLKITCFSKCLPLQCSVLMKSYQNFADFLEYAGVFCNRYLRISGHLNFWNQISGILNWNQIASNLKCEPSIPQGSARARSFPPPVRSSRATLDRDEFRIRRKAPIFRGTPWSYGWSRPRSVVSTLIFIIKILFESTCPDLKNVH